jgi:hypothetical protein
MGNKDCPSYVFLIHLQTPRELLLVVRQGLQWHFSRVSLQAFLFAYPLLMVREAAISPPAKGNKKARSHSTPIALGNARPRL